VGAFLASHFAAGWKKIGTFSIVCGATPNGNCSTSRKVGGNVVAYFCTPDLRILHAVWGPESPERFLAEAGWAVDLEKRLRSVPEEQRAKAAREAHETNPYRLSKGMWNGQGLLHVERHDTVTTKLLTPLKDSEADLFLKLVNEKASREDVRVEKETFRW
jgi:hypothetical protein